MIKTAGASRWIVALAAMSLAAACSDRTVVAPDAAPLHSPAARSADLSSGAYVTPAGASCADVRAKSPAATDGEYVIAPTTGAAAGKAFRVWCADMAGTPREYLTLAHTGSTMNYAFSPGAHVVYYSRNYLIYGTDALTSYRRLRIDPVSLVIDQADTNFATLVSRGANGYDPQNPNFKPTPLFAHYGNASDCYNMYSAHGRANIDLTGTAFAIAPGVTFATQGWAQAGSISMDAGRQVVNMTGGGWCGGSGPTGPLALALIAPLPVDATAPVTTSDAPTGWQTAEVTVTLTATDAESGVASVNYTVDGGDPQQGTSIDIATDGVHTITFWSTDVAGNVEQPHTVTVRLDKTPPVIAFPGNVGGYTVDQQIAISCSASDATSGIATESCSGAAGDAYTFSIGTHTLAASATDVAGNNVSATTQFVVLDTPGGVAALVARWVSQDGIANALTKHLQNGSYQAFENQLRAQSGRTISAEHAEILIALVKGL